MNKDMENKELQELFAAKRTTEANRRRQEELRRKLEASAAPAAPAKSRRLWPVWAGAAAASIALLIVFNWGKQQSPQDPVVAQQSPRYAVSPVSPISPAIVQPEAVPDEQPKEKPESALSEDAPQQAEPASTEDVEAPRSSSSQPILDITSHDDEPFFIASTSYMVTHRNYRDGLATTESEDGSAIQLSTKTVSQNRPPIPQMPHRDLTKKERKQVAVLGAIATKRWHIDISSMNTMRYGSRAVTSDFYLELRGDTLRSYLPYLGDAHMPTMSPSIGLNFEEPVLTYKESKPKKFTQIDIDVRTREDSYHYVIEMYDNGQAYIRVRSMNRDPISFDGTLEIE